ncbi:lipopolysaccharide cholinephosphotransferase [Oscillospiraceae bacterium]|nr:lipopolysaccharide cholinephosphotransferase [Oscillospiraceae bacterium]
MSIIDKEYKKLTSDEIKQVELDIMLAFERLCKANGLYYVLCGGTLLGAVRHKGFIPWDDDIDVLMPRDDYNRLIDLVDIDLSVLPSHIKVVSWKDGALKYPFIKLIDTRTIIENKYVEDSGANNLWIDVFPIDGNPSEDDKLAQLFKKSLFYRKMLTTKLAKVGGGKTFVKKLLKPIVKVLLLPFSVAGLCQRIDSLAQSYKFDGTDYIGGTVWGYGPCERVDRRKFMTPVQLEFEGHMFNAPSNYDEYLSGLYKDYMQLPPENKRVTHEIDAYIKTMDGEA